MGEISHTKSFVIKSYKMKNLIFFHISLKKQGWFVMQWLHPGSDETWFWLSISEWNIFPVNGEF